MLWTSPIYKQVKTVAKGGFTGKKRDARGYNICYQNGKRVPCNALGEGKKKPTSKKPVKKPIDQSVKEIRDLVESGQGTPEKLLGLIAGHTIPELKKIQAELGLSIKGNPAKAKRADAIAQGALALMKGKEEPQPTPEPEPEDIKGDEPEEDEKPQSPSRDLLKDKITLGELAKKTGISLSKLIVGLQNLMSKKKLMPYPGDWDENKTVRIYGNTSQEDLDDVFLPNNIAKKLSSKHLEDKVKAITKIPSSADLRNQELGGISIEIQNIKEKIKKTKDPKKKRELADQAAKKELEKYTKMSSAYRDAKVKQVESLKKSLKTDTPIKLNVSYDDGTSEVAKQKNTDALDFLTTVMSGGELKDMKFKQLESGDRAFYRESERAINCTEADETDVYVHEIVHGLEYSVPGVHSACMDFLEYRCKDEQATSMKKLFGGGYSDNEMGRKDDFEKAFGNKNSAYYAGKEYSHNASEVLTMGVQLLYNDPSGFAKRDPEYCAFVVGVLDGSIRGRGSKGGSK